MKEENKIAVVTGGTGFLGREIVNCFALEGYKVYVPVRDMAKFIKITDNNTEESNEFNLKKIYALPCNQLEESSVRDFISKILEREANRIDVLVNTVGGFPAEVILTGDMNEKIFYEWFDLNFKSAFLFTTSVLNSMKENNFGRIVSIGSLAGLEPMKGKLGYSLAKSSLIYLMDAVSVEYKEYNIFASTVIPSVIDTPSNRAWGSPDEIRNWVSTKEIANLIVNIVSDKFKSLRQNIYKIYGNY